MNNSCKVLTFIDSATSFYNFFFRPCDSTGVDPQFEAPNKSSVCDDKKKETKNKHTERPTEIFSWNPFPYPILFTVNERRVPQHHTLA